VAEIDYKMPSDYCPQIIHEPENAFCNRALGYRGGWNSFSYSRSRRLDSGRRGQAHENHGTVATGVAAEVDIKIGLPIIERPNVTSLIDHYIR